MVTHAAPVRASTVVVAVDVGKNEFAVSVTDASRRRLLKPRLGCPMTAPSLRQVIGAITKLLPEQAQVKVGIEAAGHYHQPLLAPASWPVGWELLELNPGHVTEQRKPGAAAPRSLPAGPWPAPNSLTAYLMSARARSVATAAP